MLKYFFHTFGSQTVLESQTLSYSAHAQIQNTVKNVKNAEKQKNISNK